MKKQFIISCLVGLFCVCPSIAQEQEKEHQIDQWLGNQLEKHSSTAGMCEALHKAGQMWDRQLNASYKYLMGKLNATQKAELQKSQRAWVAFRDAEGKVHDIIADPYFGTMGRVDAANEYYETIKSRSQKLALYESRLREKHDEEIEPVHSGKVSAGQTKVITPKRGSQLRKDICNAFRVPMNKEVNGQKIVFVIHRLAVSGDHAFINCSLQLANGKPVNWSKTKYREDVKDGGFENVAVGLLRRNAQGKWGVLVSSLGGTDVAWVGWSEQYHVPKALIRNQ